MNELNHEKSAKNKFYRRHDLQSKSPRNHYQTKTEATYIFQPSQVDQARAEAGNREGKDCRGLGGDDYGPGSLDMREGAIVHCLTNEEGGGDAMHI